MTTPFLIRDGMESDIDACLALDHRYETDYVWQMSLQETATARQVTFKTERLPRWMEVQYPADGERLHLALTPEHCFLVAATRDNEQILGYLSMHNDPAHRIAQVYDIVVAPDHRRKRIGTRLLKVAQRWAQENKLARITVETQTKNYPAIMFCQGCGFQFCGFNDHYFQNQDIALFFSQSLR